LALALEANGYTPWGDKFASLFGDVPRGVFQRERRIFVGGQTQIVSPVEVGFGTVLAAGSPLRHSLGEDRLVQGAGEASDQPFDAVRCGALQPKFALTLRYIGNLAALDQWYALVRQPAAEADPG
jgi:UDP-N-acetylglucosamine/UDP-N-acetylgalactosamine diphosphorylase